MLLVLVAGLLGMLGFSAVAGGVTLDALSHPVPPELWQIATGALAALAALLAGHAIGVASGTPAPAEPPTTSLGSTTINVHDGGSESPSEPATRPSSAKPPTGLSPHDVLGGHPDLPPPPADRSRGRATPPRTKTPLPPRSRGQARRPARPTSVVKGSTRGRLR